MLGQDSAVRGSLRLQNPEAAKDSAVRGSLRPPKARPGRLTDCICKRNHPAGSRDKVGRKLVEVGRAEVFLPGGGV